MHWIRTKTTEVDDEFYSHIASHTKHVDESASDVLRCMLKFSVASQPAAPMAKEARVASPVIVEMKPIKTIKDKTYTMRKSLFLDEYAEQRRVANRFILLLSTLHSSGAQALAEATGSLYDRTRVYFATDEQTLLKSDNQAKPKHTPGTLYWVITDTNTGHECSMIKHIMQSMQSPAELIEKIYGII